MRAVISINGDLDSMWKPSIPMWTPGWSATALDAVRIWK